MCTSFGRFFSLDVWLAGLRDERFRFAHREVLRHDIPRDAQLRGFVRETEDGAGVPHRERSGSQVLADFVGQPQQPDVVGNRRSIFADGIRDLFLGQAELVGETAVGLRLLDGIEIFALDVLDERRRQQPVVGNVADDDRDLQQPGALRGAPSAFARDDLVAGRRPCAGRRSAE